MGASVVARCNASPVLELGKQVLDLVALTVEGGVVGLRHFAASARRYAWFDAPCFEFLAEPGAVVAAIGDQMRGRRQGAEHETGALVVAHLAFRQEQDDRPAVAVTNGVRLRVQPTFCSPDTAGNIPF